MRFIRDWIRRRDEERLRKQAKARLAEDMALAASRKGDPSFALDQEGEPGTVTAQYTDVKAALEGAKQAKTEARSSARRVLDALEGLKPKK